MRLQLRRRQAAASEEVEGCAVVDPPPQQQHVQLCACEPIGMKQSAQCRVSSTDVAYERWQRGKEGRCPPSSGDVDHRGSHGPSTARLDCPQSTPRRDTHRNAPPYRTPTDKARERTRKKGGKHVSRWHAPGELTLQLLSSTHELTSVELNCGAFASSQRPCRFVLHNNNNCAQRTQHTRQAEKQGSQPRPMKRPGGLTPAGPQWGGAERSTVPALSGCVPLVAGCWRTSGVPALLMARRCSLSMPQIICSHMHRHGAGVVQLGLASSTRRDFCDCVSHCVFTVNETTPPTTEEVNA